MGYLEGYMMPSHIDGCIKGKKKCKFLKIRDVISIKGKRFFVYVCSCEEEMCAGCIKEMV